MPGVASIKWTDTNMAQALHAFIGYGAVKLEDDTAQKVADHLGNGCTATAIQNLLRTRKTSFKPGVIPTPEAAGAPVQKRKRKIATETAETTEKTTKKSRKSAKKPAKKDLSDIDDDENDDEGDGLVTPPSSGRKQPSTPQIADNDCSVNDNIKGEDEETEDVSEAEPNESEFKTEV